MKKNGTYNPRMVALNVLQDIVANQSYSNLRLKQEQSGLNDQDYRFVSALCYTTLDHLLYIDHIIDTYCSQKPKPVVRNILRLGISELLYMSTPSHAAISEYVELCRHSGKQALCGFVNAVLRKIDRERDSLPSFDENTVPSLSVKYSCPEWIVSMWKEQFGLDETIRLLQAQPSGVTVRAQYPCTGADLEKEFSVTFRHGKLDDNALLAGKGIHFTESPAFSEGRMTIQSEGAMLACRAMGDCTGMQVLDACAAPGGKSAYLASLSKNDIRLTCCELHDHRVNLIRKTLGRLHVQADIRRNDATILDPSFVDLFDAVLLDVPCSGLGLVHEKPDIRYSKTLDDIVSLASLQKKILDTCCQYVKNGGVLVYSTCTISGQENEEQATAFLNRHPEFHPDPLPFSGETHMIQLLPHIHGTDGFFIARFRKCS